MTSFPAILYLLLFQTFCQKCVICYCHEAHRLTVLRGAQTLIGDIRTPSLQLTQMRLVLAKRVCMAGWPRTITCQGTVVIIADVGDADKPKTFSSLNQLVECLYPLWHRQMCVSLSHQNTTASVTPVPARKSVPYIPSDFRLSIPSAFIQLDSVSTLIWEGTFTHPNSPGVRFLISRPDFSQLWL